MWYCIVRGRGIVCSIVGRSFEKRLQTSLSRVYSVTANLCYMKCYFARAIYFILLRYYFSQYGCNMAFFFFGSSLISCFSGMLPKYCLSDFEMFPIAPLITGIAFAFTFHMRWVCIIVVVTVIIIVIVVVVKVNISLTSHSVCNDYGSTSVSHDPLRWLTCFCCKNSTFLISLSPLRITRNEGHFTCYKKTLKIVSRPQLASCQEVSRPVDNETLVYDVSLCVWPYSTGGQTEWAWTNMLGVWGRKGGWVRGMYNQSTSQ